MTSERGSSYLRAASSRDGRATVTKLMLMPAATRQSSKPQNERGDVMTTLEDCRQRACAGLVVISGIVLDSGARQRTPRKVRAYIGALAPMVWSVLPRSSSF